MAPVLAPEVQPQTADPMLPRPYRVIRITRHTHDTFTLEMEPADGNPAPYFQPGQFNMLYLFGVGEVPISISGDPGHTRAYVHTIRAVGTVTEALCNLKIGAQVGLRGPFGSSWPVKEAEGSDIVIAAGGIGLAPLRPALYHVLAHRERYGKVVLLYGTRTPQDLLYRKELEKWRGLFHTQVEVTVDHAARDWFGRVGVVTKLIPGARFDPFHTKAFVCGPEVMMRFTVMELMGRGVETENIFISMERNMKCAVGFCGHCQYGPTFICKDGPVYPYSQIQHLFKTREL
ncbi:MAG: Ni/Fe hydrogenase subunit gamma [Planctomycetota bacterium]|nr:MAG: Ni/Fe hydrogenase subunit gamma [Planctomycetota bacterium]